MYIYDFQQIDFLQPSICDKAQAYSLPEKGKEIKSIERKIVEQAAFNERIAH